MKIEIKKENWKQLENILTQAQKRARVRTIDAEKLFDINDEAAKKSWDSYYYEVPMNFENDGYEHNTSFVVVKNGHLTDAGRTRDWRYRLGKFYQITKPKPARSLGGKTKGGKNGKAENHKNKK